MLRNLLKMASEAPAKKLKTSPPLIGTHNGTFHADEALAVYLLRLLPTYSQSPLLRTRDPEQLATCDTVVDVGGVYDHNAKRYDHHQATFASVFPPRSTKLSSAGLVYLHYGREIISQRTSLAPTSPDVDTLFYKLYDDFIEPVDANDNGIAAYSPATLTEHGLKAGFKQFGITLPSLVADLNHPLDLPPPTSVPTDLTDTAVLTQRGDAPLQEEQLPQAAEDARFQQASTLMGTAFLRKLALAFTKWLPARATVAAAYAARRDEVDASGKILQLTGGGVPWKEHLYSVEEADPERGSAGWEQVLFVLYPENGADPASKWRVQAVSKAADSFENRRGLRKEWRGVRDEELSQVAGIDGCVFVHAAGFIGGNKTREGALEMARRSLVD